MNLVRLSGLCSVLKMRGGSRWIVQADVVLKLQAPIAYIELRLDETDSSRDNFRLAENYEKNKRFTDQLLGK